MGNLDKLAVLKNGVKSRRVSSFDKTGGNGDCRWVKQGETVVLADIKGAGIIRHIWFTHDDQNANDPNLRRNMILRMYWDNEEKPSVECPFGDFFGQGFAQNYTYAALPLSASPRDGKSVVSYFSMPFSERAYITIENDSNGPFNLYYYIDYEEYEELPEEMGRFHACWNRQLTDTVREEGENEWGTFSTEPMLNPDDKDNFVFADIEGKGHFVGVNYYVDNPTSMWYGEGDDMWRIDGEEWPFSMHGTGTEDFFNTSWCPGETFIHPYYGLARMPYQNWGWLGRTHCYRFFIEDPIYFDKSLRASIEHGHANCLSYDLCSVSYWYQTEPHKEFKELPAKEFRAVRPEIDCKDMVKWRDSWKREMRSKGVEGPLWGNEPMPTKKDKE